MTALKSVKKRAINQRTTYIGALVILAVIWQVSSHITLRMNQLPVKTAPKVDHKGPMVDPKSFYPVWVKQAVAMTPAVDNAPLDSFFRRQEATVAPLAPEPPTPEPDYLAMFERQVRIDGISDNGVFINGVFVKAGAKLEAYSLLKSDGTSLVPVLESISSNRITFRIDEQTIHFQYRKPS